MYKRYKLKKDIELEALVKSYANKGEELMISRRRNIRRCLDSYVNSEGYIDMSEITRDWFPDVRCDIFLSHSHNDMELVNGLVGFMHEHFSVEVFIDSYIWGYCNELLREIDEKYCLQSDGKIFNYDKRNYSTSHVHMMLANSLNEMINKAECIIFLDSDNSLDVKKIIENGTSSPWIYSELVSTRLINIDIPERLRDKVEKRAIFENNIELAEKFKPMYRGQIDHLHELTVENLCVVAQQNFSKKEKYLDRLYEIAGKVMQNT